MQVIWVVVGGVKLIYLVYVSLMNFNMLTDLVQFHPTVLQSNNIQI